MGLGQGNRAAPPSWIQLSEVLVNAYKQMNLGALIKDPITAEVIHLMGTCPKPSDQPRDAARREECSDLDEKSLTTFSLLNEEGERK